MKRRRHGFTLLELLVVIGIILVLVAMATIGLGIVSKMAAGKNTNATHQNLLAMVDELAATNGLGLITSAAPATVAAPVSSNGRSDVSVFSGSTGNADDARYNANAIAVTQQIMSLLQRVPKNKQAIGALPAKNFLRAPYPTGGPPSGVPTATCQMDTPTGGNLTPPVFVDGWNNPVIFVPAGGLTGVTVGSSTNITIKSPDGRFFWASAGPDGDFVKGDDNVYSFEAK